ncbi:hypothetical protein M5X06_22325 [Paenibacillus alvei]|uniref:Uncharacterized protein n=1 Tax=Paenibacillus alvei TaxID=44250 RepID=A0ABT4H2R0_PAEAL|nr:hypothetical protein [Paenibacillus alvei]MCY9763184.1 hypothetical protein [Paenibacillus alvei]MCY9769527.1 hypothetical protein [Paenibacillus alvei]
MQEGLFDNMKENEESVFLPFEKFCRRIDLPFLDTVVDWMYMYHEDNKYYYKHSWTRKYLIISSDGLEAGVRG